MEVGIEKVFYGVLSVYVDNQNVSEDPGTAWSSSSPRFRINADALNLPLLFSVLEQRIFKFICRPFLEHCHFLEQIVAEPPIGLARETEGHMRIFGQEILRVIYIPAIGQ